MTFLNVLFCPYNQKPLKFSVINDKEKTHSQIYEARISKCLRFLLENRQKKKKSLNQIIDHQKEFSFNRLNR